MTAEAHFIDREQLEYWVGQALSKSLDPVVGIYGPDSLMWKLGRESIGFFGAGRAALLQLAHPWVANAIDQHSATRNDPIGRFNRTFINVFTMIYGSADQVLNVSRRVHNIHRGMKGEISEHSGAFEKGSYYQANEAHAMLWVHATLWDTFVRMYELVFGPMSAEDREQYYRETRLFAWLFGIPDELVPPDWGSFQEYCQQMYDSDVLTVAATGKEMGDMIFSFDLPFSRWPLDLLRSVTGEMMPERLSDGFGLPSGPENQVRYERTVKWVRRIYPRLPARVRYLPPYHEALRRLQGKPSSVYTRTLTKIWLGQPELVSQSVR